MATIDNVKRDYLAINRVPISDAQAAVIAAQIDQGQITEAQFVSQQIAAVKQTTAAEVATFALLTGTTQSSALLDSEVAFAKAQTAAYAAAGYNTTVAPFEALGAAIATGPDTKAGFVAKYGALSNTDYVATIYTQVVGTAPVFSGNPNGGETTGGDHFLAQLIFYTNFAQTRLGMSAADASLYAKGAIGGQIASLAFNDPSVIASSTLDDQVNSYLTTLASGSTDGYGKALPTVGTTGSTIVLTTNIDAPGAAAPSANTTGTNGDDTYNGVVNPAAGSATLNTGDSLDGKGGNDTLKITATGGNSFTLPSLTSIEKISVTSVSGAGTTAEISLLNSTGYNLLESSAGTNGVKFSSISAVTNAHVVNTTSGSLELAYAAAAVAGTTDVQNLALDSAQLTSAAATFTFVENGVETIAITSTGKNAITGTVGGISDAALKTVTSAGAGSLTINGFDSTALTSFDASKSTGVQKITFNSVSDVAVKGGSADDFFTFGTTFTSKDTVDGGTGSDTVSLTAGDYSSAANDTLKGLNALVSVENLDFTGTVSTIIDQSTLTNTAITKIIFESTTGGPTDTVTNATSAVTYAFGATHDEASDAQFTLKAGQTTLNLALEGKAQTATTAFDDANVDFIFATTGATTINLKSTGVNTTGTTFANSNASTDFNNISSIANAAGANVNVTGDANTAIGQFTNAVNVDASALTGLFKVTGSAGADLIKGGTNSNDITGGALVDTIDISASATKVDTIHLNGIVAQADRDGITGFTSGTGGDIIGVNSGDTTAPTAAGTTIAIQGVGANTGNQTFLTTTNDLLALNFANAGAGLAASNDGTALLAAVGTIATSAAGDKGFIVAYQGGNAYLYYAQDNVTADANLVATEIHLIGTLNGVAAGSVTAANFLLA